MAVFVLASVNPENDDMLKSRIVEQFSADNYEMGRGVWLISFNGTSKELTERLVSEALPLPTIGGILIAAISAYWGRASVDMWEWMANKLTGSARGA